MPSIPCAAMSPACRSRCARSPPWIAGWSVLTRPSIISGWPVTWETSVTSSPAARSSRAVPPVETSATPRRAKPSAKGTRPIRSEAEISARRGVTRSGGARIGGRWVGHGAPRRRARRDHAPAARLARVRRGAARGPEPLASLPRRGQPIRGCGSPPAARASGPMPGDRALANPCPKAHGRAPPSRPPGGDGRRPRGSEARAEAPAVTAHRRRAVTARRHRGRRPRSAPRRARREGRGRARHRARPAASGSSAGG